MVVCILEQKPVENDVNRGYLVTLLAIAPSEDLSPPLLTVAVILSLSTMMAEEYLLDGITVVVVFFRDCSFVSLLTWR